MKFPKTKPFAVVSPNRATRFFATRAEADEIRTLWCELDTHGMRSSQEMDEYENACQVLERAPGEVRTLP